MNLVLDYSAGFPGAAAIARSGYGGAVRYIGFADRRKCTNRAELEDFSRNGLGMALVYQDGRSDWAGGRIAGEASARRARAHADAIGFPRDRPIYFAIDQDIVSAGDFDRVVQYVSGAASVLGVERTGVYGEHDVMVRVAGAGVARWFWQCRAWSGTPPRMFANRHLYQRVGTVVVGEVACDINDVNQGDWGQHNTNEGDTLSWNENLPFSVDGKTVTYRAADWLLWTNYYANMIPSILAAVNALTAAVSGGTLDPAAVMQKVDTAVREATEQAMETRVLPALRAVVLDVIGADNEAQADAIVTELADRLRTSA